MPVPGAEHRVVERNLGIPTQHLIGALGIRPNLHDVARTTRRNLVRHLHTRGTLESAEQLEHRSPVACTDIEHLEAFVALVLKHAL